MTISSFLYRIPWLFVTAFSFLLFYTCIFYWTFQPDVNFLLVKHQLVNHPVWRTVFYFHVLAGMLVIATGPFQFLGILRRNFSKLHKTLGKIYITSVLFIGAPTGLYMAFFAEGGTWASVGFGIMSVLWFFTTYKALTSIKNKNYKAHSEWMLRSYAMSFSAVMLRLLVWFFSEYLVLKHDFIIVSTAWLSWIITLIAAEILIRTKSKLLHL